MLKKNIVYLDTNIILRFLIGDGGELADKSIEIFKKIEKGEFLAFCNDAVFSETVFVLEKLYDVERDVIREVLENLLLINTFHTNNREVSIKALSVYCSNDIDIVDALLIAYNNITGVPVLSFDKKLNSLLFK
jgi:predicted nucleic-acid-binding protein